MIIAAYRNDQPTLFAGGSDMKFRTFAQTRNFVGDFFEVASAAISGARRIKTDSSADICPDLQLDATTFIESKSIGQSGSIIVYKHRGEKDDRFQAEGRELFYYLWRHDCPAGSITTLYELRERLAASIRALCIVPWSELRGVLETRPVKMLNAGKVTPAGARLGYGTNGYGRGWSVPYSIIEKLCIRSADAAPLVCYGHAISGLTVKAIRREDLI